MTIETVYFFSSVCALIGMYFLWFFGFRNLYLDRFRDDLFTVRHDLFAIADSGAISFDNVAYRQLELLINALIRYGHRVSFSTYLLANPQMEHEKGLNYRAFHNQFLSQVNQLNPEVQDQIRGLWSRINMVVAQHMRRSSLVFKAISWYWRLRLSRHVDPAQDETMQKVYVFEREAYDSYLTQDRGAA